MSKIVHILVKVCADCPHYTVIQDMDSLMIDVLCRHPNNDVKILYCDMDGNSWKAHKEIHESCPLEDTFPLSLN